MKLTKLFEIAVIHKTASLNMFVSDQCDRYCDQLNYFFKNYNLPLSCL